MKRYFRTTVTLRSSLWLSYFIFCSKIWIRFNSPTNILIWLLLPNSYACFSTGQTLEGWVAPLAGPTHILSYNRKSHGKLAWIMQLDLVQIRHDKSCCCFGRVACWGYCQVACSWVMWFDEEITTVVLQLQEWVLFQALDYSEICHSGSCHASGHTIFL